jgi:phosphoribosylaminoimidazole-succinocarboxamide synthase
METFCMQIHTPDSSRYWLADSYAERHAAGQEPMSVDKEFLRLWFREHCDPYADEVCLSIRSQVNPAIKFC